MSLLSPEKADVAQEECNERFHLGLAEQGKLYALEGNYTYALAYYRQALRMSSEQEEAAIFSRHYVECIMEALEQMESYTEVLDYCERAIAHYEEHPPESTITQRDLAHIYLRQGIILMKTKTNDAAKEALSQAITLAERVETTIPLAKILLQWLQLNYQVDTRRIQEEQENNEYYSVREGNVDASRAIKLPNERLFMQTQKL